MFWEDNSISHHSSYYIKLITHLPWNYNGSLVYFNWYFFFVILMLLIHFRFSVKKQTITMVYWTVVSYNGKSTWFTISNKHSAWSMYLKELQEPYCYAITKPMHMQYVRDLEQILNNKRLWSTLLYHPQSLLKMLRTEYRFLKLLKGSWWCRITMKQSNKSILYSYVV